jgi:hypothetical protein
MLEFYINLGGLGTELGTEFSGYIGWRAKTTTLFLLGSIDCSKIPALNCPSIPGGDVGVEVTVEGGRVTGTQKED